MLKIWAKFFKIVVCNPCQSSPSLTILVPLWFTMFCLVFFYLIKLLFPGFLLLEGNFVRARVHFDLSTDLSTRFFYRVNSLLNALFDDAKNR